MNYNQFKERLLAELNNRMQKLGVESRILPINVRFQPEDTLYIGINREKTQPIGVMSLFETIQSGKKNISDLATILIDSYCTCNNLNTELCEDKLVCGLINKDYHEDLLKTIPHQIAISARYSPRSTDFFASLTVRICLSQPLRACLTL